jgi:hypothetical protein
MNLWIMVTSVSFQPRNEQFFARPRKSTDCAEAYIGYVAQAISQIDPPSAEKRAISGWKLAIFGKSQ